MGRYGTAAPYFPHKGNFLKKTEEIASCPIIITPGQVAQVRVAWPLNWPDWDYNIPGHWDECNRAKENLLEALQEIGWKPLELVSFSTLCKEREKHLMPLGSAC